MGQRALLTPEEGRILQQSLASGDANKAFVQLASFLKKNDLRLSDATLRIYIEDELFDCFQDRGHGLAMLMESLRS